MRVHILGVGKRPRAWVSEAVAGYARRLGRGIDLEMRVIAPARSDGNRASQLTREAERLRRAIPEGACVVVLDERGSPWSSRDLAACVGEWLATRRDVAVLIGGADGLDSDLVRQADHRWALSSLTLPHQLCRVIVVEQIYRAWSLLKGHPYHRD